MGIELQGRGDLAETDDRTRLASARALVKHAGPVPRERVPGTFIGRARLTGAGRPGLRGCVMRGCLPQTNRVYATRQAPDHP